MFILNKLLRNVTVLSLSLPLSLSASAEEPILLKLPEAGTLFSAHDTLKLDQDANEDANDCLNGLRWKPAEFQVTCEPAEVDRGDLRIRFPSAMPSGDPINDNVSLEWYAAKDSTGKPMRTRCVIVVHESGRGMTVGRIFARGLAAQGLHTFMVQMPGYGARQSEHTGKPEMIMTSMKQAVADARRARDAAISLPLVDDSRVGIQGTSLGGFITSTTAGMDNGFDRVFILLAGGNLHDVVINGAKDAAKVRDRLKSIGVDSDTIRELARPVEPLRLAHRLDPQTTWLYSGKYDDVVPPACSFALAEAAGLPAGHHIEMPADHYSGIVFLPSVMVEIRKAMLEDQDQLGTH